MILLLFTPFMLGLRHHNLVARSLGFSQAYPDIELNPQFSKMYW